MIVPAIPEASRGYIHIWINDDQGTPSMIVLPKYATDIDDVAPPFPDPITIERRQKMVGPGIWYWVAVRADTKEEICHGDHHFETQAYYKPLGSYGPNGDKVVIPDLGPAKGDIYKQVVAKYLEQVAGVSIDQYQYATGGVIVNVPTAGVAVNPIGELKKIIPNIGTNVETPCLCGVAAMDICHVVMHLNDQHEWSREKIADWLDTLDVDLSLAPSNQGD